MSSPKVTLHHLENSRSLRIIFLLEELKLNYNIIEYKRNPETKLAPKELRDVHPLGKSPTVTVEENGETVTLAESGAIVEYLVLRFGKDSGLGPDISKPQEHATYLYWMHYAEGSLMLPLMLHMIFNVMPKRAPMLMRPLVSMICNNALSLLVGPRLKSHYQWLEDELKKSPNHFFVGDRFTSADILMSYPISAIIETDSFSAEKYPIIDNYWQKISSMPGYKTAQEKGGDVDFGFFTR